MKQSDAQTLVDGYVSIAWNTGTWYGLEARDDLSKRQKKVEAIRILVDEILTGKGFVPARTFAPELTQGLRRGWQELDLSGDDEFLAECEDLVVQILDFTVQRGRADLPPIQFEILPGTTIALTRKDPSAEVLRDLDLVLSVIGNLNDIRVRLTEGEGSAEWLGAVPVRTLLRDMEVTLRSRLEVPRGLFATIEEVATMFAGVRRGNTVDVVPGPQRTRALELERRLRSMDTPHRTQLWVPVLQTIGYFCSIVTKFIAAWDESTTLKGHTKDALAELLAMLNGDLRLEKNDCSRVHTFYEAVQEKRAYVMRDSDTDQGELPAVDQATVKGLEALVSKRFGFASQALVDYTRTHQVFVVRHDWASALGPSIRRAMDTDGALNANTLLPYNRALFEFRISGHTLLVQMEQGDDGQMVRQGFMFRANGNGHWLVMYSGCEADPEDKLWGFVYAQITAICVALDIQVATHEVVRAPIPLNEKRKKNGKPPMEDYHVVDLSRRVSRAEPAPLMDHEPAYHLRAHLRRAHWRHFSTHKTRIPWMLVGNPELGFVHKFYLD